jgi:hypothetical protein
MFLESYISPVLLCMFLLLVFSHALLFAVLYVGFVIVAFPSHSMSERPCQPCHAKFYLEGARVYTVKASPTSPRTGLPMPLPVSLPRCARTRLPWKDHGEPNRMWHCGRRKSKRLQCSALQAVKFVSDGWGIAEGCDVQWTWTGCTGGDCVTCRGGCQP